MPLANAVAKDQSNNTEVREARRKISGSRKPGSEFA
jgi:hypothetical protein